MIISASRRTDLPACYAPWLFNRIQAGSVLVRNPMNSHQISRINLSPEVVSGIVFWTKNPIPMLHRLHELKEYMYYFQFTLTSYGKDVEPNIPAKNSDMLMAFKQLSDSIGAERVVWRYDPILISEKYTREYHLRAFEAIAKELHTYTKKVTISFIDEGYRGVKSNVKELALLDFAVSVQTELASQLALIAKSYNLSIDTCAEKLDLLQFGVDHARCIDDKLLGNLLGCHLKVEKDKTQRLECGCVSSIDIGSYNSCPNGCRYCYANYSPSLVAQNFAKHDPLSPLLFGEVATGDKITDRKMIPYWDGQRGLL